MIVAFAPSHPTAATLQPEADGTFSITAFGEKLVVPRQFAADIYVSGGNYTTCVEDDDETPAFELRPPKTLKNSLQRWLVDPAKAKCFEQLAPTQATSDRGEFTLVFVSGRDGLWPYPGVAGLDLRRYGILLDNLAISVGSHSPGFETCVRVAQGGKIDRNGYLRNGLLDGWDGSFLRAGGTASASLCIFCQRISGWTCSAMLTSTEDLLTVTASWGQPTGESSPAWAELDAALRRFAAQASPYRDKEDLH